MKSYIISRVPFHFDCHASLHHVCLRQQLLQELTFIVWYCFLRWVWWKLKLRSTYVIPIGFLSCVTPGGPAPTSRRGTLYSILFCREKISSNPNSSDNIVQIWETPGRGWDFVPIDDIIESSTSGRIAPQTLGVLWLLGVLVRAKQRNSNTVVVREPVLIGIHYALSRCEYFLSVGRST